MEYTSPQNKTHADGRNSVERASALKFSTELEKMLKHEEVFDVKTVSESVFFEGFPQSDVAYFLCVFQLVPH